MDPRLQGENEIKIANAAGIQQGQYEVLDYAGPSLWMTNPHQPSHTETFWWEFEQVSLGFHRISCVIIVGHNGCGGFALKGVPPDPAKEKQTIIKSLKSARDVIAQKHPELQIKLLYVTVGEDKDEGLPEIEIESVE